MKFPISWVLVFVGALSVSLDTITAATLDPDGGYNLVVGISSNVDVEDQAQFLAKIQDGLKSASKLLFQATDLRVYLKNIDILVPETWTAIKSERSTFATYANADVRIEKTFLDDGATLLNAPRTKQSKPCGYSAERILLFPEFFIDTDQEISSEYGDKAKVLLHEWAHFRYGVFEEYGYSEDAIFPYFFTNTKGNVQVTGCNDSVIAGKLTTVDGEECRLQDDPGCRFRPDLKAINKLTTSLMYMQFLPEANNFCDHSNHDNTVPNKHNYWCRNRSVKTVVDKHADMKSRKPLPDTTDTTPKIRYVTRGYQLVSVLLDVSKSDDKLFQVVKDKTKSFLAKLARLTSPSVLANILTMGGPLPSPPKDHLGGYLTEEVPVATISTSNLVTFQNKLAAVTQKEVEGLFLEKSLLDLGDRMTPYSDQSGSIVLFIKLGTVSGNLTVESEFINLLNSRSSRLVTVEHGATPVMWRVTDSSNGFYFGSSSQEILEKNLDAAFDKITNEMITTQRYQNRKMQIAMETISLKSGNTVGTIPVDMLKSPVNFHFHIPIDAVPVSIQLIGPKGEVYDSKSVEYEQKYTAWNMGKYRIYSFKIPVAKVTKVGFYTYNISSNNPDSHDVFVDAVEDVDPSKPITIGGGGSPVDKLYEIEVFTSSNNGKIDYGVYSENPMFLMYAAINKGIAVGTASLVTATVYSPADVKTEVMLKDDGVYPDMLKGDGVYTGYHNPGMNDGLHRISVRAFGLKASQASSSFSYALPISQDSDKYCCGSDAMTSSWNRAFQRILPYAATVNVQSTIGLSAIDVPQRIMDLRIADIDDDDSIATLTWTAPQISYSTNAPVKSYRLVYSSNATGLIDEDGRVYLSATSVSQDDVIKGSLEPGSPGAEQSVTIKLKSGFPLYFVITSTGNTKKEAYPSPMVFIPGTADETTTTQSTTTSTTTKSTTTTSPTTTTKPTTTSSTTTTKPTTTSSTTTKAPPTPPTSTTTTNPPPTTLLAIQSSSPICSMILLLSICLLFL